MGDVKALMCGEGFAAVILKRVEDVRDGDPIRAVTYPQYRRQSTDPQAQGSS